MVSLLMLLPVIWAQVELHDIHAAEENNGGEQSIRVLVEGRILKVVVVEGDEE